MVAVLVLEAGFQSGSGQSRYFGAAWGEIGKGSFDGCADLCPVYQPFEGKGDPPGAQPSDKRRRQDALEGARSQHP